jgi:hypothetical protein
MYLTQVRVKNRSETGAPADRVRSMSVMGIYRQLTARRASGRRLGSGVTSRKATLLLVFQASQDTKVVRSAAT